MGPIGGGQWLQTFWDDFKSGLGKWQRTTAPSGRDAANIYTDEEGLVIKISQNGDPTGITWGAAIVPALRFGPGSWIECESKQPYGGHGAWTGFWLSDSGTAAGITSEDGSGASMAELDIFEYCCNSLGGGWDRNYYTLHQWAPTHVPYQTVIDHGVDLSAAYHRYAIHWDDAYIKWYFDDQLIKTESAGFYEKSARLILQNQSDYADQWPGPVDGGSIFPHYFRVKWVSAWHRTDGWRGFQRLRYTPGTLTTQQQTDVLTALKRQYNSAPAMPNLRTQARTSGAQGWLVEITSPAQPTLNDWIDILYTQISGGMTRPTLAANLVLDNPVGADWDARRLYAIAQGW